MKNIVKKILYIPFSIFIVIAISLTISRVTAHFREVDNNTDLAPKTGQFVETKYGRLFVQVKGSLDDPPVLLVHGTGAWSSLWNETSEFLSKLGYRVIAIDLPPFGFSDHKGHSKYDRSTQAARINAVLDKLKIKKTVLIGHSFGSGAAVEALMKEPSKFSTLILIDAALNLMSSKETVDLPLLIKPDWFREVLVSASVTNPLLTKVLLSTMLHKKEMSLPRYIKILQQPMTLKESTSSISNFLPYLLKTDLTPLSAKRSNYSKIQVPIGLIWGEEDTVTPIEQAHDLHSLLKGSTLKTLKDVGHIPQIENPTLFQKELRDILGRWWVKTLNLI